jgi:hypothetical protein
VDKDFARPQYRAARKVSLVRTPLAMETAPSTVFEYAHTNKYQTTANPKKLDFSIGAKAHRKSHFKEGLYNGVVKSLYVTLSLTLLIVVAGLGINWKYGGKALPFTYVGDIPIGGLSKQQIQDKLNQHYQGMKVHFVDGGLTKTMPIENFYVVKDTKKIADQAIPKRFNPFMFLAWQRLEVPIKLNERALSGYMRMNINNSKAKAEDAEIVFEKNKLVIKPDTPGTQIDSEYAAVQIKNSLSRGVEPFINVNTAPMRAKVTVLDLADDYEKVNSMINTPIAIKIGNNTIKPNQKQKIAWMNMRQDANTKSVNVDFYKGLVRAYLVESVSRFYGINDKNNKKAEIQNVDEVADAIVSAMSRGVAVDRQLKTKYVDNSVDTTAEATTTNVVATMQTQQ